MSSSRPARDSGLDVARAVAVVAMVLGHTLDATLSLDARDTAWFQSYRALRAVTAPLFLAVSGWAVVTAISRAPAGGLDIVRGRAPRIALLFALGFLLRFPVWGFERLMTGDAEVWRHFLAFDALHCVASGLLLGAVVMATFEDRGLRMRAFLALALVLPFGTLLGPLLAEAPAGLQLVLAGPASPFPLFPWLGYFALGAFIGSGPLADAPARRAVVLGVLGFAFAVVPSFHDPVNLPRDGLVLYVWRVGMVLLVLALTSRASAALGRFLAPLGRASLAVYVLHLPVVYGWGTFEGLHADVGRTLGFGEAAALALVILAACLVVVLAARWITEAAAVRLAPLFGSRVPPAPGPVPPAAPSRTAS